MIVGKDEEQRYLGTTRLFKLFKKSFFVLLSAWETIMGKKESLGECHIRERVTENRTWGVIFIAILAQKSTRSHCPVNSVFLAFVCNSQDTSRTE